MIVASVPFLDDPRLADRHLVSPLSGTGPLIARYIFLCSRKRTGSSSRIAARSRPAASAGVAGATTCNPGVWTNIASMLCE